MKPDINVFIIERAYKEQKENGLVNKLRSTDRSLSARPVKFK